MCIQVPIVLVEPSTLKADFRVFSNDCQKQSCNCFGFGFSWFSHWLKKFWGIVILWIRNKQGIGVGLTSLPSCPFRVVKISQQLAHFTIYSDKCDSFFQVNIISQALGKQKLENLPCYSFHLSSYSPSFCTHVQYTWTESGRQLLLTTRLTGCRVVKFKKEVSFTAGSRTAWEAANIRRIVTIRSGRDDPSVEKSTRLMEVSGRERKIKTSMNTGKKC